MGRYSGQGKVLKMRQISVILSHDSTRTHFVHTQWQIQDFPWGGHGPIERGCGPSMWVLFGENVCKTERTGSHLGGGNFVCRFATDICACLTNQVWQEEGLTLIICMLEWCNQVLSVNIMDNTWIWKSTNI